MNEMERLRTHVEDLDCGAEQAEVDSDDVRRRACTTVSVMLEFAVHAIEVGDLDAAQAEVDALYKLEGTAFVQASLSSAPEFLVYGQIVREGRLLLEAALAVSR